MFFQKHLPTPNFEQYLQCSILRFGADWFVCSL